MLDAEGRHASNHAGHKQSVALLEWRDRELADKFSSALVALVRGGHPGAFDEAGP